MTTAAYQRGEPNQVMQPVALATAVAEGDLVAVVAALAVPAPLFTWATDLATTRKAFVAAFLGRSAQAKDAAKKVFGNGGPFTLSLRVDTAGVYRYPVAAGTYALYDYLGPAKDTGNALTSTLEKVTDPAQAVAQVMGLAGVNPGYVDAQLVSGLVFGAADATAAVEIISIPVSLANVTAADVLTNYTPGFAGEVLGMDFRVNVPVTTAAKAATFTPKITGVAVTGGVVALTSANATPMGKVVAGSAVTAANVFTATDTLSITASAVTAFVEGSGELMLKVRNRGAV